MKARGNPPATGIACMRCAYDLTGLGVEGVCPECGCMVRVSLAHADGLVARRLPRWLRTFRTMYFAIWGMVMVSPVAVPWLPVAMGLVARVSVGESFFFVVVGCALLTALAGLGLYMLLEARDDDSAWMVGLCSMAAMPLVILVFGFGR